MSSVRKFRYPSTFIEAASLPMTMEERDRALEDFLRFIPPPTLKFNQNGAIAVLGSDEDPMGFPGRLIQVAARLTTAGTSTTTAILKRGASTTIATFTFSSGNHTPDSVPAVSDVFALDDYYWVDTTAAGTGAKGLVVCGWAMSL